MTGEDLKRKLPEVWAELIAALRQIGEGPLVQLLEQQQGAIARSLLGEQLVVFAIIGLVLGILQIAAGAGAMGGRGFARWIGIILSIIFAIFLILGGLGGLSNSSSGGIGSLVVGVLYALTAWALISGGAFFSYRR